MTYREQRDKFHRELTPQQKKERQKLILTTILQYPYSRVTDYKEYYRDYSSESF